LRSCVDKANAEDIEAASARNMTVGIGLRGPKIQQD